MKRLLLCLAVVGLVAAGCRAVDVVPLFLGAGGHVRKDIPVLMAQLQAELKCGTNCGSCLPQLRRRDVDGDAYRRQARRPPRPAVDGGPLHHQIGRAHV